MLNRLELLRIFAVMASAPSFRDAAARLSVSPQVVTRAVQELEQELGEMLFHRNTRRVQITAYGRAFAEHAQAALESIDGLFEGSADGVREARGTVRITAPAFLGRTYVMPVLSEVIGSHLGIGIDLRLSDIPSAVVDEQIDVGVRVGLIADNRFVARHVGGLPMWIVASPSLLERVGEPKNLKALESVPLTSLIDRSTGRAWPWVFRTDDRLLPPPRSSSRTTPRPRWKPLRRESASANVLNIWCALISKAESWCGFCENSNQNRGSCMSTGPSVGRFPSACALFSMPSSSG